MVPTTTPLIAKDLAQDKRGLLTFFFFFLCIFVEYLYATLANVVITLTSMFGIVVLLCTACTGVFQLCIQFCISLAVGSLTGDALLHLLPMVGRDSLKTQKPKKCAERSCRHINCRAVTAVQPIIWVFS